MKIKLITWSAKWSEPLAQPSGWQGLPQGEAYRAHLQEAIVPWLKHIPGYQIAKLGSLSGEIRCDLPLRHQITVIDSKNLQNFTPFKTESDSLLCANMTELPFIERSIDGCLLANTLNFSQDPHQLLREVCRVLNDDGLLLLSLFNPLSPLLWKRKLGDYRFRQYPLWRILDWLALLHFDILHCQTIALTKQHSFCAPLQLIVAQKRRYPLNFNLETEKPTVENFLSPANAFKLDSSNST